YVNILNSDSANPRQACNSLETLETIIDAYKADEGSLASPKFPELYPKCINSTYYFRGRPGQRVFLRFVLLELGDTERCKEDTVHRGDRLYFYDGSSTHLPVQLSVCGSPQSVFRPETDKGLPTDQNLAIASSGSHFTMLFASDEFVGKFEFGFRLEYHFRDLISWDAHDGEQKTPNSQYNITNDKKGRLVYFNYPHKTIRITSISKLATMDIPLYIIIALFLVWTS
uniref:CUB domain-containing protein n=1 Tax=Mesocestoides corti TaxID=53468 RepID=A0A5K3EV16_MESCO